MSLNKFLLYYKILHGFAHASLAPCLSPNFYPLHLPQPAGISLMATYPASFVDHLLRFKVTQLVSFIVIDDFPFLKTLNIFSVCGKTK